MPKIDITLSTHAREAAEMFSTPAALEAKARREVAAAFGPRFALKSFVRRTMRIELHFEHADEWFTVEPVDTAIWLVETRDREPAEQGVLRAPRSLVMASGCEPGRPAPPSQASGGRARRGTQRDARVPRLP